jgi:hypothetical protein
MMNVLYRGSVIIKEKVSPPLLSRPLIVLPEHVLMQTSCPIRVTVLLHHRCTAKLPLCRRLHSGEEHRPYSARCLQIRRDGRACNAVALSIGWYNV